MKIAQSLLSSLVVSVASQGAIFFAPEVSPEVRARAPSGGVPSQNRPTFQQRPTQRPTGQRPVFGQRPISQNRPTARPTARPTTRPTAMPTARATTKKTTTTTTEAETTTSTFTTTTTVEETTPKKIVAESTDSVADDGPGDGERLWGNYNSNNYNNQYPQNNQNYNGNQNYGNNAGAGGYAQADPHFMVETLGQPPICFDYDPETLDDLVLFSDPSGLSLVANMFENEKGRKFIESVKIRSPEGASIVISAENGLEEVRLPSADDSVEETGEGFAIGDLKIKSNWNGIHEHHRVHVHGGPAFAIISNTNKKNLEVVCYTS
ncbi:unnamed protein product [Oikopleura dioica]|uniref:Uncharacterized protein n=1 Tax=Oikopleura dioica TaxID=34765 RepID=E4XW58_OIKDI|nr:unnamed protein product [Oikopleura dioica]